MIKAEIRKSDKVKNSKYSLYISFDYNPNNVIKVKKLIMRIYNPITKEWESPLSLIDDVKKLFPGIYITGYNKDVLSEITPVDEEPLINYNFKLKPFPHQLQAFNYGMNHKKWLLGDEMGLGKTKVSIDICGALKDYKNIKHSLIICGVNSVKYNWKDEVELNSDLDAIVIDGSHKQRLNLLQSKPQEYFYIINIEALRNKEIIAELQEQIRNKDIGIAIIDEIHKCKNSKSLQGKAIHKINTEYKIGLTGTPLMNNPIDLYNILKWLDIERHSFYAFRNMYCVMGGYGDYQIVDYKNLDILSDRLYSVMLRRLKQEVLTLPDKIYKNEYLEMSLAQRQIYKDIAEGLQQNIDLIVTNPNPLAMLTRLRQATADTSLVSSKVEVSCKLDRLEELIEEITDSGNKAIVFSNWTSVTDKVAQRLNKYNPAIITGNTKDRQSEVNKFQRDNSCKVFIGTIGAAGTGLTLTAGSYVIFMDNSWNPANQSQAEDRAHRIGQSNNVTIINLICKNTIDESIISLLKNKQDIFDVVVNNKDKLNSFIRELLFSE